MTRHKQSAEDRQRPLSQGLCPVHGIGLGQIGFWYKETNRRRRREYGTEYTLEADGRRDCQIVVTDPCKGK